MDQLKFKMEKFNSEVLKIPYMKELSEKTGIPAGVFILIDITIIVVLVAFNFSFSNVLVQIVGVIYPVFKSIKALETRRTDDDQQWLTYWCLFSLFQLADSLACCLLHYIPFYKLIKLLILIWLQNPLTNGAQVIYEDRLSPLAKKYKV